MTFSMGYKIMKTEWYELNIGNKKIIYRKTVDGLLVYLFCGEKAMRSQWRARIEQERRNQRYYVDENYPKYLDQEMERKRG